jgi:DNA-binding CsgD family transcriptional regulator
LRAVPLALNGRKVITDKDITSAEEMQKSPYFNEFIYPNGFKWWAAVSFHSGAAHWALSIQRTHKQGPFERVESRALAGLTDRLTAAATLSKLVGRVALTSSVEALALLDRPAVVVDQSTVVLGMNEAAESLFDSEIGVRDRRLRIRDKAAAEELSGAVRRMSQPGDRPANQLVVARRQLRESVAIRVHEIPVSARTPFLGACALLTFVPLMPNPKTQSALFAKAFALTPAETRLASLIAAGMNPETAAQKLGISRTTARNQLRAIFAKTATRRQSELVALLSRF